MLTSTSFSERYLPRTWWFVYGAWALMTLQALVFIVVYALPCPVIDEWDFVEAVNGEEPFWPWLWQLHNEHRFVLPRLIWLPLVQWTRDFRIGCYISLIGMSGFTLQMVALAHRLRGRLHYADAFFPVSLLHLGHWENWRMGYQLAFMICLILAGGLLQLILTTASGNLARRGWQAGLVTLLLMTCGASGLAFGPFMLLWLLALGFWSRTKAPVASFSGQHWFSLLFIAAIPAYIWLYLNGFHRPGHHPDPVEVWGGYSEAGWQAARSALQALSMTFGPAASGIWPFTAPIIVFAICESFIQLLRVLAVQSAERPRALGLALYLAAVCFMAYGIGWGRCVFTDHGGPGFMGLSSRYGWIVWPGLGALYFHWLIYGGPRWSRWGPVLLLGIALAMLPFNTGTGIIEGQKHQALLMEWEKPPHPQS